jgi:hypothetical protein
VVERVLGELEKGLWPLREPTVVSWDRDIPRYVSGAIKNRDMSLEAD